MAVAAGRAVAVLQWPLRDIFRAWSRDANDLGQWLFALYVAMAFTAATRAHTHSPPTRVARHYPSARAPAGAARRARSASSRGRCSSSAARNLVIASLRSLEAFADTYNPGYFMIKLALWLLAGLVLMQAIIDIARPRRERTDARARPRDAAVRRARHRLHRASGRVRADPVAVLGAAFSVVTGTVSLAILTALPGRLVNLLENDLMQALPLYVFMGLLLDRLPSPMRSIARRLRSCRAGPPPS
jgi:hypothetical protein